MIDSYFTMNIHVTSCRYVHWDGNASFSDFKPFGGWTTPTIKQYKDNAEECEVNIDKNWY